jgi:hypothetical protein
MTMSLLRTITVALFAGLLAQQQAMAAEIKVDKLVNSQGYVSISLTGEIKEGDDLVFARLAKSAKYIWLHLDSPGGELDTAMAIGSIVRNKEGTVLTSSCYSACVLIFAGGVRRTGSLAFDEPVVGVHRTFFTELQTGLSTRQVKKLYDSQLNRVRRYLAEMNVAPELLSFMQSIEPGDIHVLTKKELNLYGLGAQDVIYAERSVALQAEELGISSLELRNREQRGRDECVGDAAAQMVPSEAERANAIKFGITIKMMQQVDCKSAIHYGISVETYLQRWSQVNELCRRYPEKQQGRCENHFMVTGRATP